MATSKIQNIPQNSTTPVSSTKPAAPTAPNSVITAAGTTYTTETQTAQSPLDKALAEVLGENYPKIKEELHRIIEKLGIHAPKKKHALTEAKIKNIAERVKKLVDNLKAKKLEINAENLFKEACNVIDMKILDKNGISLADYKKAVENGEAKSLREILGIQEGEELTEEKVAAYAQKSVKEAQERIKNSSNPTEALKREIEAQKKQFALCLVSTPVEDRSKLMGAMEHVYSENKGTFIKDILLSLTPEGRIEFANQIGWEKVHKLLSSKDAEGNTCTIDEKTGIIATISTYQKAETIQANEEQFMTEAKTFFAREDVIAVQNKIKNGEKLTEAEQAIAKEIETYTAYQSGSQIGTANSVVLTEEAKNELLDLMNRDAYELPTYKNVLEQINSFIKNEENAEYLNISKEELVKILDKTTNGNYSIVASGSEAELKAPKDMNATSGADLGYVADSNVDTTRVNELRAQIAAQSETNNTFEIVKNETPAAAPKKEEKSWSKADIAKNPMGFFRAGLKNISESELVYAFNRIPTTIQSKALEITGGKTFDLFFEEASNRAILGTGKGRTLCQTKRLEEKREEIKEQTF